MFPIRPEQRSQNRRKTEKYIVEEVPQNMFSISSATEIIIMEVPQKI